MNYRFSGHETFHCKHIWLKKGFDYLNSGKKFSDPDAIVELGVGKNMVQSIKYWLEVFGVTDEYSLNEGSLGKLVLSDDGFDPYLNDIGSLWLLHYALVTSNKASIYSLFFNKFRKQRVEFTSDLLKGFIRGEVPGELSDKMLDRDINVFLRNYLPPQGKTKNIEDDYSVLLQDLNLLERIERDSGSGSWYKVENKHRDNLPWEIVLISILYCLKDRETITFFEIMNVENGPGSAFALHADSLYNILEKIVEVYPSIIFKEDADIRTLQIKDQIDPINVLQSYYE